MYTEISMWGNKQGIYVRWLDRDGFRRRLRQNHLYLRETRRKENQMRKLKPIEEIMAACTIERMQKNMEDVFDEFPS